MPRAPRARSRPLRRFTKLKMQILKVEITGYISLSKIMSLRDEIVRTSARRLIAPRVTRRCVTA